MNPIGLIFGVSVAIGIPLGMLKIAIWYSDKINDKGNK